MKVYKKPMLPFIEPLNDIIMNKFIWPNCFDGIPSRTVTAGNRFLNCSIKAAPTGAAAGRIWFTPSMCLSLTSGWVAKKETRGGVTWRIEGYLNKKDVKLSY